MAFGMTRLPSTDLYFLNAMAPWVRRFGLGHRPVRAVGANAFVVGEWFVLIRRDSPRMMRKALDWPGRLAYVVDDDVAAGAQCAHLPPAYRARLAAFDRDFHAALLARAEVVLAASDALAGRLRARTAGAILRIDPVWRWAPADTSHFAPLARGAPLRIVQLGSASHLAALHAIAPLMRDALDRCPSATFTYFSPRRIAGLEEHPRARRIEPMTWPEYQRWMGRNRFHLALYPLMPSPFDRARSQSKLIEHALVGAAGMYPEDWSPALAHPGLLLAPGHPGDWRDAIANAIDHINKLQSYVEIFRESVACIHPFAVQQALWKRVLSIEQC